MYNSDTEILFPLRVIPSLRSLRGAEWQKLVDKICAEPTASPESLAFVLFMVRLAGCMDCQADSYRALQGCTYCAGLTIKRFSGDDIGLLSKYADAFRIVGKTERCKG